MIYRTQEQYQTIVENMLNGNWNDAAQNCIDFGFYASDLLDMLECDDTVEELTSYWGELVTDFVYLVQLATQKRDR